MTNEDVSVLMQRADSFIESGQLQDAKQLFHQVCEMDEHNAEAWMMVGVVNSELGLIQDARQQLEKALEIEPDYADAHYFLANILAQSDQAEAALGHCSRAVELDEEFSEAWGALGALHGQLHQYPEAAAAYRKAVQQDPENASLQLGLGQALQSAGDMVAAEEAYRRAIQLQPSLIESYDLLGALLAAQHRAGDAIEIYKDALLIAPDSAMAASNLGKLLLFNRNDPEQAVQHFQQAIASEPDYAEAHQGLGNAFFRLGAVDEALVSIQKSVDLRPDEPGLRNNLAALQRFRGQYEEAYRSFEEALRLDPDNTEALAGKADLLQRRHQPDEAYQIIKDLLGKGVRTPNIAVVYASICRQFEACDEAIQLIQELLSDQELEPDGRRPLHFALGKLLDENGKSKPAFEQFAMGNELDERAYDWQQQSELIDASIEVYARGFENHMPSADTETDRPVFIVGMPRSGTSLVEQILAAHPEVYAAGELNTIGRLAGSVGQLLGTGTSYPLCMRNLTQEAANVLSKRYLDYINQINASARKLTDKMPLNFLYLGLISRLFPRARIIHCVRHPLDTCLSIYFQSFGGLHPYSTRLTNIGAFYSDYVRLMKHWERALPAESMMRVQYEDLVNNLEDNTRRLVDFCGLDWDARCLEFYKTERHVATASYDQVRQPIYTTSIGRWKKYQSELEPLVTELKLRGVNIA